jgi:type 1 glutamine amidotransferase/sugar phosphate isomerase/epimerase
MGKKTGAFETTVSNDPAVFQRDSLKQFDAVFFNNTVGNCFTNAELRRNLLEFITGGGGLMGMHGTSVGFTRWPGAIEDWPEFGLMIGARGAAHKASDEHIWIKLDDRDHPLNRVFGGQGFDYRDEFFRFGEPYSRQRVRVLLSMDTAKTDMQAGQPRGDVIRADNDYALAWVRNYGQGRVFYSTIAHNPHVFWDSKMLQFYLGAAQFALGDLPAPTTPSAKLTPAVRAQEKLGWRLGIEAYTFHKFTLFETIEKTAHLGLPYIGGLSFQKVSQDIPKNFDPQLSDDELRQIRLKLESAGVRLLTFYIQDIPNDEAACRKIFEFGRKMGIETFMSEPKLEALPLIDKFCNEYGINVSLHNHDQKASPQYWNPEGVLKACQGRSKRIGACGDLGYWMRSGIDPIQAIRTLKDRLLTVQMHDLHAEGSDGHDVPWGTGVGKAEEFFRELHRLGIKPTMIGLEYSYDWLESLPKVVQCKEFFDATTLKLAP